MSDHGCQKVVGCADGMEVAGEVEVDVLHGNNLCVAAACSAAFNAEYRSKGWLTESYHNVLAQLLHAVCQTYGGSGPFLRLPAWVDGGYQDQLAVLFICLL